MATIAFGVFVDIYRDLKSCVTAYIRRNDQAYRVFESHRYVIGRKEQCCNSASMKWTIGRYHSSTLILLWATVEMCQAPFIFLVPLRDELLNVLGLMMPSLATLRGFFSHACPIGDKIRCISVMKQQIRYALIGCVTMIERALMSSPRSILNSSTFPFFLRNVIFFDYFYLLVFLPRTWPQDQAQEN